MNEGLIPRRYAKALLRSAAPDGIDTPDNAPEAKALYGMMVQVAAAFDASVPLQQAMANPFVSDTDKCALLRSAAGLTDNSDIKGAQLYDDYLKLLTRNGRLPMARAIALAYIDLYRTRMHIYAVHVTSAKPMDPDDEQRLRKQIERHLGGATMEYSSSVDPALIGGFTVDAGNQRLDASVADELRQLRLNLLNK